MHQRAGVAHPDPSRADQRAGGRHPDPAACRAGMSAAGIAEIVAFGLSAFVAVAGALGMATTMSMFRSGIFLMASFYGRRRTVHLAVGRPARVVADHDVHRRHAGDDPVHGAVHA